MRRFPFPDIRERKIELAADNGELVVKAPAGVMRTEILDAIRQHKAELLDLISARDVSSCLQCPASSWWCCLPAFQDGFYCFGFAYFYPVKACKPKLCKDLVQNCQHQSQNGQARSP